MPVKSGTARGKRKTARGKGTTRPRGKSPSREDKTTTNLQTWINCEMGDTLDDAAKATFALNRSELVRRYVVEGLLREGFIGGTKGRTAP